MSSGAAGGTRWMATRWLRQRWVAVVPLAVLLGIGTAGATMSLAAAQRTSTAYRDHLRRADVGDVIINPSLNTREVDQIIRSLPGVESVTSDALFSVSDDEGEPRARAQIEASGSAALVVGSHDGRFVDMDRPIMRSGRMATGPDEAVITANLAATEGLHVGDRIPLAFWGPTVSDGLPPDEAAAFEQQVVSPIGVEHVTIVGIITLADDVLPDELYPSSTVIVSPDIAARYDCLPATFPPGSTFAEAKVSLLPEDCATSYRYYSLALADGAEGVKPLLDQLLGTLQDMNVGLSQISDLEALHIGEPPSYFLIPTDTQQGLDRVERSIRPSVAAFLALGIAVAAITVLLSALIVSRELRRTQPQQVQWHQLGVESGVRATIAGFPIAAAALAGLLVGVTVGWLLDPGPVGLVRAVEPHVARRLVGTALVGATAISVGVLIIGVVLVHRSASRIHLPAQAHVRPHAVRLAANVGSPAVTDGLHAAYVPRTTLPVLVGGALLTTAFVAASVFGTSLNQLVSTPRSYGWPWDLAAMTGSGYGDLDLATVATTIAVDPAVASWTSVGFVNDVSLNGEPVMSMVGMERSSHVDIPLLEGSLPVGSDEIALGATTASDRGLHVGDSVQIGGTFDPRTVTITGLVVFPSLGPLMADRVGTGVGMMLTEAMVSEVTDPSGLATFIGVDLREGFDTDETRTRLEEQLGKLDLVGQPALEFPQPIRPAEIVDASSTRTVPLAVGSGFAAVTAIGLGFAAWASARSRRRDLAVLRTLGFSDRQVRWSVRVQSMATGVGMLLIGLPLGVIVGRVLWRSFADQLGVLVVPAGPWVTVLLAGLGGIVVSILAAEIPAHLAARSSPAVGLRAE